MAVHLWILQILQIQAEELPPHSLTVTMRGLDPLSAYDAACWMEEYEVQLDTTRIYVDWERWEVKMR